METRNNETGSRVVGYIRVSTDKQAEKGCSLEAQREKLEAYAKLYDLELVAVEVDAGASAKSLTGRPALDRALTMLRRGDADALLVAKLDRLTRSIRDLGDLVDRYFAKSAGLLSVAEQIDTRTAAGRLVLNVLGSVSQWERETIGERTSEAMQHKACRGEHTGGRVPYGYSIEDGRLVENEAEQQVITAALQAKAEGLSLRAIGRRLAERGFLPRTGGTWHASTVRQIVTREPVRAAMRTA